MTTKAIGAVSQRTPQVPSYTVSTSVVNPTVTVNVAVTPPSPAPTPPVYVAVDGVATSLDDPGMSSFPVKINFIQAEGQAVQSAAQNTALAFGLNTTTAADNAIRYANATFQASLNNLPTDPTTTTTNIVIPS